MSWAKQVWVWAPTSGLLHRLQISVLFFYLYWVVSLFPHMLYGLVQLPLYTVCHSINTTGAKDKADLWLMFTISCDVWICCCVLTRVGKHFSHWWSDQTVNYRKLWKTRIVLVWGGFCCWHDKTGVRKKENIPFLVILCYCEVLWMITDTSLILLWNFHYIFLIICMYFYLSKTLNAGLWKKDKEKTNNRTETDPEKWRSC